MRARYMHFAIILTILASFLAGEVLAAPGGGRRRPPPVVSLAKVVKRSVRSQLSVLGTVDPYRTSIVSSEIEGRVKSAPVKEGDPVIAGKTVLAALERSDLEINLRIEQAELAKAEQDHFRLKRGNRPEEIQAYRARYKEKEAELKRDKLELKRTKDLFDKKVLDRSTYDRAIAKFQISQSKFLEGQINLRLAEIGPRREEIAKAKAEMDRVKGRVESIRDQLSKAIIRAPLTGFLTEKAIEIGQWVAKGGKVGEVIEIQKVLVRAPVSERQISYVQIGESARVRLDAIPGRTFTGRIVRVIPKADTKSRTFPIEVELNNTPDNIIKAGMFARVFLEYGESVQAVLIPKDAVLIRPRGAAAFVFEKGSVREVTFVPGRGVDSFVEVPEGKLKPGMTVVVQGNENLRNGMKVQLRGQGRGKKPRGQGAPATGRPVKGRRQG